MGTSFDRANPKFDQSSISNQSAGMTVNDVSKANASPRAIEKTTNLIQINTLGVAPSPINLAPSFGPGELHSVFAFDADLPQLAEPASDLPKTPRVCAPTITKQVIAKAKSYIDTGKIKAKTNLIEFNSFNELPRFKYRSKKLKHESLPASKA